MTYRNKRLLFMKRMPLKRNSDSKNGKPKLNRWFMERKSKDFSQNIKKTDTKNRETKKVKGKSKKSNIRIMGVLQRE